MNAKTFKLPDRDAQMQQLMQQNAAMSQVLQLRAQVLFGAIMEAIDIRRQQALAGDAAARHDLATFCNVLDIDRLRAASNGIHLETPKP